MRLQRPWLTLILIVVLAGAAWWQRGAVRAPVAPATGGAAGASTPAPAAEAPGAVTPIPAADLPATAASTPAAAARATIGFRSRERLVEHYEKHGREFGTIAMDEYLKRAQALRDAPAGGDVIERGRDDGVTTRFDRASGAFIAFDRDGTIRTFFRPNQGETYFWRQLERRH